MSSNVIGLFESKSVADKVAQELLDAGFNQRNINRYEGSQDELERELGREGISDADADYYAEGLRSGGALVSVRAKDNQVDEAVDIMNRYANTGTADDATYEGVTADAGTVDYAASSAPSDLDTDLDSSLDTVAMGATTEVTDATTAAPLPATTNEGEARLAVAEERLVVGKRAVERGGMRVRRVVTERPVEEQVTLRDETIRVDRRRVDQPVSGTASDLFTEQTFEFTETDEEAVVAKEARVIEEVVVGKTVEQRTETVRDTVRRSDVQIEEIAATYGQTLASDARYSGREWAEVETEARSSYERDNAGGEPWDSVRDSIRNSYEGSRNRR